MTIPLESGPSVSVSQVTKPPPAEVRTAPTSKFPDLVRRFAARVDNGERLVQGALRRDLGALDAGSLIAVQAGIYRYTEAVELVGKLVDRAAGAIRQVLQPGGH